MVNEIPEPSRFETLQGRLEEAAMPDTPDLWALAPGWYVLLGALGIWIAIRCVKFGLEYLKNRYRREALARVAQTDLMALPGILKATALRAYPRAEVASLTGEAWLLFLDHHYDGPAFQSKAGRRLLAIAYRPDDRWPKDGGEIQTLTDMVCLWISSHGEDTL